MDFNNTGAMRSPFSPRVRQTLTGRRPIGLGSAKKNQNKYNQAVEEQGGEVIYKTPLITLETYGAPLPVMVTEAFTFGQGSVSVGMGACGWCWAVVGRRVLAWARGSPVEAGARTLTLPQTDLAHKADLVTLFYEDGAQMPSCIGVSPEGVVRFWASVGQEGAYVDASCELAGQECDRLAAPAPAAATAAGRPPIVLATTTCTLVLLTVSTQEGRPAVTCRTLRPPSGWLGGIGRRVSLLFFGSMPAHADTKLVGVVVLGEGGLAEGQGGCVALVAGGGGAGAGAGPVLQAWRGAELHEHSLRRALCDAYARTHAPHLGEPSSLEIAAMEVRASGDSGLLLLIAVGNVARSPDLRYAIAHISLEELASPRVTSLLPLRWPPESAAPPRFLPLPAHVLLYTPSHLALVSSSGAMGDKAEYVDVAAEGDRILSGELCGAALLFSARHGPLRLAPPAAARHHDPAARSMCESPMGSPCPSDMYDGNLSLYEIDPHEISAVTTDACGKLKTAFLFHLRRETAACRDIVHALFPPPPPPAAGGPPSPPPARRAPPPDEEDVDHALDRTVLQIATEMLDDMPAGDPRWKAGSAGAGGAACRVALGSSAALQVAAQLQDKKRAFTLFLDFLRATHLYQRLRSLTLGGSVVRTEAALRALAEQLAAATALRGLQQGADAHLIDAAIHQVVCGGAGAECAEEPEVAAALGGGALSASDAFYRRVSGAWRVLLPLCASRAHAAVPHAQRAAHARAVANILNTVVSEMQKTRAQWGSPAPPPPQPMRKLLPALLDFQTRAVTECAHGCEDANLRAQVLESAATLAALLLAEAAPLQHGPHTEQLYRTMRRDAIQPFIAEGQLERAGVLAERFQDLELLVQMCVAAGDLDRLCGYIDKYMAEGMCALAFAWLWARGGHAGTLVRRLGARYPAALREWARVPARAPLAAAHALHAQRHASAARHLARLAHAETQCVDRMTTAASLAKLCLLAAEEVGEEAGAEEEEAAEGGALRRAVEARLALGEQHAALPRDLRLHYGLDAGDMRVHEPHQLVQMYVECESASLTEFEYKKALDLTDFVPDMERRDELRLQVWCASVRRDAAGWAACDVEAPQRDLHNYTFFRLLHLVHLMGGDVELLLPPLDDLLTAPALAELAADPRFHFMLRYGYETLADPSDHADHADRTDHAEPQLMQCA